MPQTTRFTVDHLVPAQGSPAAAKSTVRLPALVNWAKGIVLGFVTGTGSPVSEVQRITVTSTPSGTFILQWNGTQYQTEPITYSGTAGTMVANIQAALNALFGAGAAVVSGTGPYDITFAGELANVSIPLPTIISSLSGGSLAVTEQAVGHPGTGLAVPYDDDGTDDGRRVAKVLLIAATKTDIAGEIIGNTGTSQKTYAEVFVAGTFLASDLVGLDAAAVADLGRIINATAHTAAGAMLQMK